MKKTAVEITGGVRRGDEMTLRILRWGYMISFESASSYYQTNCLKFVVKLDFNITLLSKIKTSFFYSLFVFSYHIF